MSLLLGIAALAVVWWLSKQFTRSNPAALAKLIRTVGGVTALGGAALMLFRGRIDMTVMLGGLATWLLGWNAFSMPSFRSRPKTPGSVSRVRSAMIEMTLDHDTGAMNGTVLAGAFAGQTLDALPEDALRQVAEACLGADLDGLRLLEAYLDRRFPRWREDADGHHDAGAGSRVQAGPMTEQEAYQILGLQPGAGLDEIRQAHRTLMKKLHPDQGGSTYLAARVNEAKEILLSRHR